MFKSIIIGAGPAGLTAAVYLARAGLSPLVIKGLQPSSHLINTMEVEYFPGFPQGIKGPELLDNMFRQAEQFGAQFKFGRVVKADLSKRPFVVLLEGWGELQTETLIVATGTTPKFLGIPGEEEHIGRGVSYCASCRGFWFQNKKVVVVGGGDSAMEEAIYLARHASEVKVVHRRGELRASKALLERTRELSKVSWNLNRTPLEVVGNEIGVTGLKVRNNESGQEEVISADAIFVAIGKTPNIHFLDEQLATDERGYLLVKPGTTETGIPGVFACGDVMDKRYGQILNAVGTGCMAAIDCERFLIPRA